MKLINYIESDTLVAEVKNILKSWFDSSKTDESYFYPVLKRCLSKLKFNAYPEKFAIISVENYKAKLPKDFFRLCQALACLQEFAEDYDRYDEVINTEERHVCELNLCETVCDVCHDGCGNMYKVIQTFNRRPEKLYWNAFEVLCIGEDTKPMCTKDCFNFGSKAKNEIEIKNGEIHTTFCEGLIYIEYLAFLEQDDNFLIPDNETIINWIKSEMIYEILKNLYYNGEADILQRMQLAKQEAHSAQLQAMTIYKRSELHDYYDLANKLIGRYNRTRLPIWDNCIYSAIPFTLNNYYNELHARYTRS